MFNVVITAEWSIVYCFNQDNSDIFGWFVYSGIMFLSNIILIEVSVQNTTHKQIRSYTTKHDLVIIILRSLRWYSVIKINIYKTT